MAGHLCPWWLAYTFDHPLRPLLHNPVRLFGPYVSPGQTVLDLGCGLGWASLGLAELVGETGRVVSLDLQPRMLQGLMRRAARRGLEKRITPVQASAERFELPQPVDFALAFYVIHEVPDQAGLMTSVRRCLKPAGRFLIAEPRWHVTRSEFEATLAAAGRAGLAVEARPTIRFSHGAVLGPTEGKG